MGKITNKFKCGRCSTMTAKGAYTAGGGFAMNLHSCASCGGPTAIKWDQSAQTVGRQYPGARPFDTPQHVPHAIATYFEEANDCFSVDAYAATELIARKIIMHVAVEEGDSAGRNFVQHLEYLKTTDNITSKMKPWVDKIRQHGNSATHEITPVSKERAEETLKFTRMLLVIVYELPGTV